MKKRDWVIFVVLIILILVIILAFCVFKKNGAKDSEIKDGKSQKIYIELQNFDLENRAILINENELLIGENQKELQNGYYDVKVLKENNCLVVYLNKLWYGKYEEDNIQEEYLAKICRGLIKCLNINGENEEIEYQLYKYLKENYLGIKNSGNNGQMKVDKFVVEFKSIDNQCVMCMKVE